MPRILCFNVNNNVFIGFVNSVDMIFSIFILYFLFLLHDSKLIQNYYNQNEKILSLLFLCLLVTIFLYSLISLFNLTKNIFQKIIIEFRFLLGNIFSVFSIYFLTTFFFIIKNCYEKLSEDNSKTNFINILFPKFNKENEEDLKNLREIYIWYLSTIIMVFAIFISGFNLKMLKFNKDEDEDMVVSTWRRRSSLNKELN